VIDRRLEQYYDEESDLLRFYETANAELVKVEIVGGLDRMLPSFRSAVGLGAEC
jgi:CRISPR/Cas system-associated endoribonuclease Cas2